jgi:hypothetical protein
VREYLEVRPADPEGWLLAAWAMAAQGRAAEAAAVARYATTLDPLSKPLLDQANAIAGSLPP